MAKLKGYDEALESLSVLIGEAEGLFEAGDVINRAAEIYNDAAIIPSAMKEEGGEYHGVDPVIAVEAFWPVYIMGKNAGGNNGGNNGGTNITKTQGGNVPETTKAKARYEEYSAPSTDKDVVAGIKNKLKAEYPQRLQKQRKTKITRYVFDKPNIRDWDKSVLGKEPKAIPAIDETQLEKYRKMLDESDADSVANFKILEDAVKNGKALAVYLPEKVIPKVYGSEIQTPSAGADSAPTAQIKTGKETRNFLLDELCGAIPNENSLLGCKLFLPKKRIDESESFESKTKSKKKAIGVTYVGVEDAYKNNDLHLFVYDYDRDEKNKIKQEEGKVKLDITFKCLYKPRNGQGQPVSRAVRVSGKFQVPVWKLKEEMSAFRPTKVAGKILDDFDENDSTSGTADIATMIQGIYKGDLGDNRKDYSTKMHANLEEFQAIEDMKAEKVSKQNFDDGEE